MELKQTTKQEKESLKQRLKRIFHEDQYHLGSVDLANPTKNHYIIGLFPVTKVHGKKAEGKIRTIGISSRFRADSNMNIKDNGSYGIVFNNNKYGDNCKVGKSTARGIVGNFNRYGDNCVTDRSIAEGIVNINEYGYGCEVGKSLAIGIGNDNIFKNNCTIKESSKAIGLFNFHTINDKIKFGLLERSIINKD